MSRGPDDPLAQWDQAIGAAPKKETSAAPRLTLRPHPEAERKRPEALYRFFEGRKISRETVDALGVYAWPWAFPGEVEAGPSLVFPTRVQGREVARTYRHRSGERYDHEHSAEAALYNGDAIEDPDLIVWASQALGVAALMEAGYPQSVAIESGEAEDRRFLALDTHADMLAKAGKIILALDETDTDRTLREELARRLGRHRCYLVTWPDQCAGPAATLVHLGPDALREAIEAAEPYPIEGVQRITSDTLTRLLDLPPPPLMGSGIGVLDDKVKFPMDGRLIVTLGIPNHGKTPFVRHIMMHQMEYHDRKWAVFSPEMRPWQRFVASCAQWLVGKPFQPSKATGPILCMTKDEVVFATQWLRRRLVVIVGDAERELPTIDWLFERVKACVLVDGTTDVWIDPWNEIAHTRGAVREDEYLRETLMRCLAFGNRYGVNFWINVHPVTLRPPKPGEKVQPPGAYDIAGGAMWFNKADLMFTVHRPASDAITEVFVRKSKDPAWARRGDMVEITYDVPTGRYSTPAG